MNPSSPDPAGSCGPSPRSPQPGASGRKQMLAIIALLVFGMAVGALIFFQGARAPASDDHAGRTEEEEARGEGRAHETAAKGPQGGQRFTEGDFTLELLLADEGGEPRFKAWLYRQDAPVDPAGSTVRLSLARPGGERQEVVLNPAGAFLQSDAVIAEPHAFEATVAVQLPDAALRFSFSQAEGELEMSNEQAQAAGIRVETSGQASIRNLLRFPGEIRFNEDRTAHIVPRVTGVVDGVHANLGQQVKRGQVLAVISSIGVSEVRAELQAAHKREALARTTYAREKALWEEKISPQQDVLQAEQALREAQIAVANAAQKLRALGATPQSSALGRFELRAPFDGVVVEKHIALGEAVREDTNVFTISDLSAVWAEMSVAARDLPQVRVGEKVVVRSGAFDAAAEGAISYVGSLIGEQTRTAGARVTLANPQGAWRPGLHVNVEVVTEEKTAPVTVSASAIQTVEGVSVVFVKTQGGFVAQPVQLGRTDGARVEIVSGLQAGVRHAASGSFVLKSEQGKDSAAHSH